MYNRKLILWVRELMPKSEEKHSKTKLKNTPKKKRSLNPLDPESYRDSQKVLRQLHSVNSM